MIWQLAADIGSAFLIGLLIGCCAALMVLFLMFCRMIWKDRDVESD